MYIGKRLLRDEDDRYLRGLGEYTDDMHFADLAYVAFTRSPHAHARITNINTADATNMEGVLAVLDAETWVSYDLGLELPAAVPVDYDDGHPMNDARRPVFARHKVCCVGDPVAAVVATTSTAAIAGAEAVVVDYEPLEAIVDVTRALSEGAPVIHDYLESNEVLVRSDGDREAVENALKSCYHVTELTIRCTRVAGNPMEPRIYTGQYDPRQDKYTIWASAQLPHALRRWLAKHIFRCSVSKIRVVVPDVGGAFGTKAYFYPEQAVVLFAARLVKRPVRFVSTRSEGLQTDAHARDFYTTAKMGFNENGKVVALNFETLAGFGAYQSTFNAVIAGLRFTTLVTNIYKIPFAHARITGVYTNTSMIDAYRGVGEPPITVCERLIDKGARELGLDPLLVRVRNYILREEFPYKTAVNEVLDSGDPQQQHKNLVSLSDYSSLRSRYAPQKHERIGIGMAAFIDRAGMGPSRGLDNQPPQHAGTGTWEAGRVEVQEDMSIVLSVGTHSHGQGHDVTFRQIVADNLQVPIERISLKQGDTDRDPGNFGTGAMRSLTHGGMALHVASMRIVEKAKRLAAHMLEAAEDDVEYVGGDFSIVGTDRVLSFEQVAQMSYLGTTYPDKDFDLGLDETIRYDIARDTFPVGMLVVVVSVDIETGVVSLRDLWTVNDCGNCINPMIVDGQIHGGLAQGVGQALCEEALYDDEGQLVGGSFMDYCMPKADMLPTFSLGQLEIPTSANPLGAKGVAEIGVNGVPAAIGNALVDALSSFGLVHLDPPYTPFKVWSVISQSDFS